MSSSPILHREGPNYFDDPLRFLKRGCVKLYSLWVSMTYPFASKGRGLSIHYSCDLLRPYAHRIKLGNSVVIMKDAWLIVSAPPEEKGEPLIVIDDNCSVGPRCQLSAKNCIHLERDVIISASVLIIDHNHANEDLTLPIRLQETTEGGRIRIGQGCWIGHGAAIMCDKGELTLGRNCVVAANAVVTKSAPPYSVLSGNPARVVKQFDPERGAWVLGSSRPAPADPGKKEQLSTDIVQS